MKQTKGFLLGLLLALAVPTLAFTSYNYFAPGGALTCSAPCTSQTVILSNGSFLTGNLLQSGTLTGTYTGSSNGNQAIGAGAEQATITGTANNAYGLNALASVTSGVNNNALGAFTLQSVTTGNYNDAFGNDALRHNTGSSNTAIGEGTLFQNIAGSNSTCVGNVACLNYNGSVGQETALGNQALMNDLSGQGNVAVGFNTADVLTTGNNNTILGTNAGGTTLSTGSFNILIGNSVDTPSSSTSNYLNIGNVLTCTGTGTPSTSPCNFAGWISMLSGTDAHPSYNFDQTGNTGWGFRLAGTTAIRVDTGAVANTSIAPAGVQSLTYQVTGSTPQTNSFYLPAANCPGVVANSTLEMEWCTTGILAGAPTGGLQGTGTINAQGLYVNGTAVSTTNLLPLNNTWTGVNTFDGGTSTTLAVAVGDATHYGTETVGLGTFNANPTAGDPPHILDVINSDGTMQGLRISSYGTGAVGSTLHFVHMRGTITAPAALQLGDNFLSIGARGYDTAPTGSAIAIEGVTTENWTSTSHNGSELQFQVTPIGSSYSARTNVLRLNGQNAIFSNVVGNPAINTGVTIGGRSSLPALYIVNNGNGTDNHLVEFIHGTGFAIGFSNDANSTNDAILTAGHGTGAAVASVSLGNTTDNPPITVNGVLQTAGTPTLSGTCGGSMLTGSGPNGGGVSGAGTSGTCTITLTFLKAVSNRYICIGQNTGNNTNFSQSGSFSTTACSMTGTTTTNNTITYIAFGN